MYTLMLSAIAVLVLGFVPARKLEKPANDLADLKQKLHGAWKGLGPCEGKITFRANGTYERTDYGPAGDNTAGVWKIRWDALPPTLLLTCTISEDPMDVGKTLAVKLIRLDNEGLELQNEKQTPVRYARMKK